MRRWVLTAVTVGAALALAAGTAVLRPWGSRAAASAAPSTGAPSAKAPTDPLRVEATRLSPRPVELTVTATGTLVANESVAIAPELSRRLVRVHAEDGKRVKKGQLLFELDARDLVAQRAELAVRRRVVADVEARQKKLLAEGLSSAADYDRARADVEIVDAQLASLDVTLSRTRIVAPFDGRLGLRAVSEGAMVGPDTRLVTLQDDGRIKVDFLVPERYAPLLAEGAKVRFSVEGLDEAFEAVVSAIEPTVDAGTRSLRVRGLADNPRGLLHPGSFVAVQVPLSRDEGGLLVPSVAVVPSLGGHGVWRVRDGKAELVPVELGVRTEGEVQIEKGLAVGDLVITSNVLRLRPGAPVVVSKGAE